MRTHRKLLVYNYAVTFKDDILYMEWDSLKRYLTRPQIIDFIRQVRRGRNSIEFRIGNIVQVIGV
jgi:hypothetical protein